MGEVVVQDVYTLQIRRQSNQSNPSPYCEACKNGMVHVNSIQVRQFTQSGKLPGVCKSCNDSFLRICRLQIRHLTHSETHPHVCPKCNKSFTHAGNIKKHMLLHEQKESEESTNPESVKRNIEKPKPPFECKDCKKIFVKYGSFLKHGEKHVEKAKEGKTIDLDHTEKPIDQNEIVVALSEPANKEKTSNASEGNFPCDQCDRTFTRNIYLVKHYQTDHEVKFSCQVCDKVFKSKPLLCSHMRSHKHICKLCKKSFTVPEELEVHLQNHLKEQQVEVSESKKLDHICSVCQRGFAKIRFLKKHFLTHTVGSLSDSQKSPTKPHINPQLKGYKKHKIFRCKLCSKFYKFRRTLNKHVTECHPDS